MTETFGNPIESGCCHPKWVQQPGGEVMPDYLAFRIGVQVLAWTYRCSLSDQTRSIFQHLGQRLCKARGANVVDINKTLP